ncbi:MAG: anaerobic ribonucleoside-triphosphate reductase activating protein [Syntrophomonadaceae bacterium]|jgi:pyruvate formate lyase activating enzyme|nr:anaerobic ribonucleoside-triphosphate reductase activating protein [Syntrophomonadaceae bacterium]
MRFAGLIKQSLVDYPGEVAAVIFSRGCNMLCPFCHNGNLIISARQKEQDIDEKQIKDFLQEHKGFLDGVVFSGGEPTLHKKLPDFIEEIKSWGYLVKLDTNGTNPEMLNYLLDARLLDYVAMDIKAPLVLSKYKSASGGRLSPQNFANIRNCVNRLLGESIMVEFRTTAVPALHEAQDIIAISEMLAGAELYSIQQFNPENAWDSGLRNSATFSRQELQDIAGRCARNIQKVRVLTM